jgi:hypothetical protein
MFIRDIDVVRVIHAERVERDLAAVRIDRAIAHGPGASIRRIVGRSIVRFGSWLAAEPLRTAVRSH